MAFSLCDILIWIWKEIKLNLKCTKFYDLRNKEVKCFATRKQHAQREGTPWCTSGDNQEKGPPNRERGMQRTKQQQKNMKNSHAVHSCKVLFPRKSSLNYYDHLVGLCVCLRSRFTSFWICTMRGLILGGPFCQAHSGDDSTLAKLSKGRSWIHATFNWWPGC